MSDPSFRAVYDLLYIADRAYDLEIVRTVLKDHNHRLRFNSVPSFAELREYVTRTGRYTDAPLADLILIDIPVLNETGVACIRYLRQDVIWKAVPIVALVSGEPQTSACYDALANACVPKPQGLAELAALTLRVHDFWFKVAGLLPPEPVLRMLAAEASGTQTP
jgi:CheY-like chemotaxis protein